MSHNGLPDAWTTESTPVSTMFTPSTTTSPIVRPTSRKGPLTIAARPSLIHTPSLAPSGSISIVATPDEFANLISALNRATGQGQPQVKLTQDPIAMGLVGFGLLCLTGIGGYSIAAMSAQTPAAIQKAELDRIERISARESAATRKMAEQAMKKGNFCIAWSCPGEK
jgi:hypothetical protein